jgi:hypothetical protein
MAKFVYLYRLAGPLPASPAEMQARMQKWSVWMKDLIEKKHLIDRGAPLERSGRVVRGKDRKNVTDGPYAEKDLVGGYSMIEAKDLDEACALAVDCPILGGGSAVEVRPVAELNLE